MKTINRLLLLLCPLLHGCKVFAPDLVPVPIEISGASNESSWKGLIVVTVPTFDDVKYRLVVTWSSGMDLKTESGGSTYPRRIAMDLAGGKTELKLPLSYSGGTVEGFVTARVTYTDSMRLRRIPKKSGKG